MHVCITGAELDLRPKVGERQESVGPNEGESSDDAPSIFLSTASDCETRHTCK